MSQTVKRTYRASARKLAAEATRGRIRAAAAELFVELGYPATTMRQIAHQADVGERTLYDGFGSKAALFTEVLGVALVGDEAPVPVVERAEMRAALSEQDGRRAVELLAHYTADILERAGDLIMVSVAAAGADPDMRAATAAGGEATRDAFELFATHLDAQGCLSGDVDRTEAADRVFAIASPHVHQLLRRQCKWSADRYRTWLDATLASQLLPAPA